MSGSGLPEGVGVVTTLSATLHADLYPAEHPHLIELLALIHAWADQRDVESCATPSWTAIDRTLGSQPAESQRSGEFLDQRRPAEPDTVIVTSLTVRVQAGWFPSSHPRLAELRRLIQEWATSHDIRTSSACSWAAADATDRAILLHARNELDLERRRLEQSGHDHRWRDDPPIDL